MGWWLGIGSSTRHSGEGGGCKQITFSEEKAEEKTAKAADAATKIELTRMVMQHNESNLKCSLECSYGHISHLVHNE